MSGKAPSNYKRRSFGIPHVSKSLSPNVACPGSSLKQLVFARERGWNVILAPRFQTLLAGIFQTKEQSEPKEHTVSSCNIVVLSSEKKNVWEKVALLQYETVVWMCVLSFLWCSPLPRGQSEQLGRPGYESLKEGPVFAMVVRSCTWCNSFCVLLSPPFSLLLFPSFFVNIWIFFDPQQSS